MARNVSLTVLRGVKSNIPLLNIGELYLATDEVQLYVGTSSGNQLVLANTLGIGNGTNQAISARNKGTGTGPTQARQVVQFAKIIISGQIYWIPLMQ